MEISQRFRFFCKGPLDRIFASLVHDLAVVPPSEAVGVFCQRGEPTAAQLVRLTRRRGIFLAEGTAVLMKDGAGTQVQYHWGVLPISMVKEVGRATDWNETVTFGPSSVVYATCLLAAIEDQLIGEG